MERRNPLFRGEGMALPLQALHVLVVLRLELVLDLRNQLVLRSRDFRALRSLPLDLLVQFLRHLRLGFSV